MTQKIKTTLFALGLALHFASNANAVPMHYGEVLTSTAMPGSSLDDVRIQIDLGASFDPFSGIDYFNHSVGAAGTGLGSSMVPPAKNYTHLFTPTFSVDTVNHAALHVLVFDDGDLSSEKVVVQLGDTLFDSSQSSWYSPFLIDVLGGNVTGSISGVGDSIAVTLSAERGDFRVVGSALTVAYDGHRGNTAAIPEPGAALLFAVGAVLIASRTRR